MGLGAPLAARDLSLVADGAGTELGLAVDAAKELESDGKKIRVVSMVSWELFEEQDQQYKVRFFTNWLSHVMSPTACYQVSLGFTIEPAQISGVSESLGCCAPVLCLRLSLCGSGPELSSGCV